MSNPFRREETSREISDVNVVPLADVSLVLLIILLVLSPMMTQSMLQVRSAAQSNAPAPQEPEEAPAPQELVLVVTLGPNGISVGDRVFRGMAAFLPYMTAVLAARTDKKVFLSPGPEIPNGQVVNMLENLKLCGASIVALVQTQDELQASSSTYAG